MQIKFGLSEIPALADGYWSSNLPQDQDRETKIDTIIAPEIRKRGWFTKLELVEMCRWKTPRSQPRVASNQEKFIRAVTQTALSTTDERLRIEVLTLLKGVSWPTASVILHFCHPEPYPILDFRALWSLGVDKPPVYDFDFWMEYTNICRGLTHEAGVSMRMLDRALWQYSKENQGKE